MVFFKRILLIVCLSTSMQTLAAKYCSTPNPSYDIVLNTIDINPGANIGDIVGSSGQIKKTVTCSDSSQDLIAFLAARTGNTGISIQQHVLYDGSSDCAVMPSGYDGLGVAWYNYNSSTGWWACASSGEQLNRGLPKNGSTNIIDEIYLVKTGKVSTGNFDFNRVFQFNEVVMNSSGVSADFGALYTINLKGDTVIRAPVCTSVARNISDLYKFSASQAVNQSFTTGDRIIDISCDGYIENNTKVPFKITSANGIFLDSNYFATASEGLGVSIKYKVNSDTSVTILKPTNRITVPIIDNKGSIYLNFTPYIKAGSGVYPYLPDNIFNISIIPTN